MYERLAKSGVVFENYRINACTSSRSVIYTGRHIQQTRMFDSTNFPWMQRMSNGIKTIGQLFCFNMFASQDSAVQHKARALLNQPGRCGSKRQKR